MNKMIKSMKIIIALTFGEALFSLIVASTLLHGYYTMGKGWMFIIFCLAIINAVYAVKRTFPDFRTLKNLKIVKKYAEGLCPPILDEIEALEKAGKIEEAKIKQMELGDIIQQMSEEIKKYKQ